MRAALRFRDGNGVDRQITLAAALAAWRVQFERRGDRYWIVAGGATPLVNGRVVVEQALAHNDVIQIDGVWIRYLEDAGPAARAAHARPIGFRTR